MVGIMNNILWAEKKEFWDQTTKQATPWRTIMKFTLRSLQLGNLKCKGILSYTFTTEKATGVFKGAKAKTRAWQAQMVKNPPAMQEMWFWFTGGEDLLEKGMATPLYLHSTPVYLPGEFHGQRSLVGYSPWGHKTLDTAEWLILTFH